jgi:hypothetical protein
MDAPRRLISSGWGEVLKKALKGAAHRRRRAFSAIRCHWIVTPERESVQPLAARRSCYDIGVGRIYL